MDLSPPPASSNADLARLSILLFGPLADRFGRRVSLPVPAGGLPVAELRARLAAQLGEGGEAVLARAVRVSVDRAIVGEAARVRPGQEVAVLPIFSGG